MRRLLDPLLAAVAVATIAVALTALFAGSITREDGATRTLVASVVHVARFARGLGDGRLAVLGQPAGGGR